MLCPSFSLSPIFPAEEQTLRQDVWVRVDRGNQDSTLWMTVTEKEGAGPLSKATYSLWTFVSERQSSVSFIL